MAYTQEQLDAVDAAITNGTLVVRHGETSVQYRSIAELLAVRRLILQELEPARAVRRTVAKFYGTT